VREDDARRPGSRLLCAVPLCATVPLLAGCGGGDQSTLEPASKASREISTLWWVMLVGSAVVFAVVLAAVTVVVARRRERTSAPDVAPPGRRVEAFVALAGVVVPLVVLVTLFGLTLDSLSTTSSAAGASRSTLTIDVTGRQWFWDVAYLGSGVRTANELHLPVGETVTIAGRTGDVIHSFWVPELNRKIDLVPGRTNAIRLRPDRTGVFRGQCSEFCGLQHAHMAFTVVVESRDAFDAWLARQQRPPPAPSTESQERGLQTFLGSACVYCHRIAGTNASGTVGPDLSHVASRRAIGAGVVPNTPGYLAAWILDPQHFKPGNRMPGTSLDGDQLQDLLAYLETLR
jgi:cytochrome c oxidase subunit 2